MTPAAIKVAGIDHTQPYVWFRFTIDRIDIGSGAIMGNVQPVLYSFSRQLRSWRTTSPDLDSTLTLSGVSDKPLTWKLSSSEMFSNGFMSLESQAVSAGAGTQEGFPFDDYWATLVVDTVFSGPLDSVNVSHVRVDDELPRYDGVQTHLDIVGLPPGWRFSYVDMPGGSGTIENSKPTRWSPTGVLVVSRGPTTITFILGVLASPLLITIAFTWRRWRRAADGEDVTSPLELASALLALLTLRQVLVPADMPGITWVDKIQGWS
jgi:hypothetical protein